jgi:glutaredoxin
LLFAPARTSADDAPHLTVHLFRHEGCPYCRCAEATLTALLAERPAARLAPIDVGVTDGDDALFAAALAHFSFESAAVPLVVIGDRAFLGFAEDGRSADLYRATLDRCLAAACGDVVAALRRGEPQPPAVLDRPDVAPLPETVDLPFFGTVRLRDLSLPVLTVVLGAVDGFNPCAMWVLVFLIGLLLGLEDERRMWILGGAFLFATAVVYFVVMAAWLNLVVALGAVAWVRLAVGVLAIGGGLWFLWEFHASRDAICRVTDAEGRTRIMRSARRAVTATALVPAVLGIMGLAVAVNFVELICSAGVPVVFAQILAMSDLAPATHYALLLLYLAVFMLDDVVVFVTAMVALRVGGLTGAYARWSHLVGGIVLVGLGLVMLFRPGWLG